MGMDLLSDIRREIDARLAQLRPALTEYEQLLEAADALGLDGNGNAPAPANAPAAARAVRKPTAPAQAVRRPIAPAAAPGIRKPRAVDSSTRETISGVLEHGSHTVGELAVVTAMSIPSLNTTLRKLSAAGLVAKTQREGRVAWSLVAGD